jgi:hypothetical protein
LYGVYLKAQAFHVGGPGLLFAWAAVGGNNGMAGLRQGFANSGTDTTHATGNQCDTFCHGADSLSVCNVGTHITVEIFLLGDRLESVP